MWGDKTVGKMVTATLAVVSWAISHSLNQVRVKMPNRNQVLQNRCQTENRSICLDTEILGLSATLAGLCL